MRTWGSPAHAPPPPLPPSPPGAIQCRVLFLTFFVLLHLLMTVLISLRTISLLLVLHVAQIGCGLWLRSAVCHLQVSEPRHPFTVVDARRVRQGLKRRRTATCTFRELGKGAGWEGGAKLCLSTSTTSQTP